MLMQIYIYIYIYILITTFDTHPKVTWADSHSRHVGNVQNRQFDTSQSFERFPDLLVYI